MYTGFYQFLFATDKILCLDGPVSVTGKKSRGLMRMHTKLLLKFCNGFCYPGYYHSNHRTSIPLKNI